MSVVALISAIVIEFCRRCRISRATDAQITDYILLYTPIIYAKTMFRGGALLMITCSNRQHRRRSVADNLTIIPILIQSRASRYSRKLNWQVFARLSTRANDTQCVSPVCPPLNTGKPRSAGIAVDTRSALENIRTPCATGIARSK